jgi:hypothetical protein
MAKKRSTPTSKKTTKAKPKPKPKKRDPRSVHDFVGRPTEITNEQMEDALHAARGKVFLAAVKLGCCGATIYHRMKNHPVLKEIQKEYRGQLVDKAVRSLEDAVEAKEGWAVCFTLKTLGKSRGFVERKEVRVGGDSNAPPIQSQQAQITLNPDDLPLDMRIRLLDLLREKKRINESVPSQPVPQLGLKELVTDDDDEEETI